MHLDFGGEKVVHDGESDVLLVALVAIHPEKFWQQRPRILKQKLCFRFTTGSMTLSWEIKCLNNQVDNFGGNVANPDPGSSAFLTPGYGIRDG
jgi:hypothetical protein